MRRSTLIATRDADAYLATFASASEHRKYAAASAARGTATGATSRSTGTALRAASPVSAPVQALVDQVARVKAEGELVQVGERALELALRLVEPSAARAACARPGGGQRRAQRLEPAHGPVRAAAVSRRRRSSSPASTIRRREAASSASCVRTSA